MGDVVKASEQLLPLLTGIFRYAFGYIISYDDNMHALVTEMSELKGKRDDMKDQLHKEQRGRKTATKEVKNWLNRVAELEEEVSKMEASSDKKAASCLGGFPANGLSRYQLSMKAEKMLEEVRNLKNKTFKEVAHVVEPGRVVMRPGGSVLGMDSAMEKLREYARNDRVTTIGIYGMGGVGKTNLLEKFNNEYLQSEDRKESYLLIWVDMTNCRTVEDAQKAVSEELGLQEQEKKRRQERARNIFEYLQRKTFVLVLDNVWEPIDLDKVGIPTITRQPKSKIILTTRIEDVCASMDAKKVKVECLGEREAWILFVEKTGEKKLIDSNPRIGAHAEALVKKCGGLPLALITLGRAMATKKTVEQWKHAATAMDIAPWEIKGMEETVLSCLKPSYDKLADEKLKTCLLYCTLHPEGSSIYKENVICYSIGEGIIDDHFANVDGMYNKGHDLLGVLKAASLLESDEDEGYIKMHPMIRMLVLWMGREENRLLVRANAGMKGEPDTDKWRGVERISLMHNNITVLSEIPDCPSLLTLLLPENPNLASICDGFFHSMRNLRVLDLSWTSLTELPAGIEALVGLQYFDVCGTPITALPRELGALVKLKFVLLSETRQLETIPNGVIASFSDLQVLYMENSYAQWRVDSDGDGVDFEELCCLKRLKALDIIVESQSALEKLLGSRRLASAIRRLHIKGCPTLVEFNILEIDSISLQVLRISDSGDLESVVIDDDNGECPFLPDLHMLYLEKLSIAKFIWKSGCLQNLRILQIWWCNGIETLIHCDDESIEEDEQRSEAIDIFPNLTTLDLYSLPKFYSLSGGRKSLAFPSLETLVVDECPNLKKLELNAAKLRVIRGTKSWWDGLEWEDNKLKSKFLPLFQNWY